MGDEDFKALARQSVSEAAKVAPYHTLLLLLLVVLIVSNAWWNHKQQEQRNSYMVPVLYHCIGLDTDPEMATRR